MLLRALLLGIVAYTLLSANLPAAEGPQHRRLTAVPFTAVKLDGVFWAPRIRTNRQQSLPHNFQWCEQTGRISNFAKVRKAFDAIGYSGWIQIEAAAPHGLLPDYRAHYKFIRKHFPERG